MKRAICVTVAAIALLLASAIPGDAAGGSRGRSGVRGRSEFHGRHEFVDHRGFRSHHGVDTHVFIGSGFWWGAPLWWGPDYPYYVAPPVVYEPEPQVYIQQQPQPQYYWYYCPNPAGYYPYIQQCPTAWLTVVPPSSPPAR